MRSFSKRDLHSAALPKEFLAKKLKLVREIMQREEIDLWITFTREGNPDPVAADLGLDAVVWRSAALIDASGNDEALVGNLDAESVRQSGIYDSVYGYGRGEGASTKLGELVASKKPKKIALNSSTDYGAADGLTSGMAKYLKRSLRRHSAGEPAIVSSEDLVIALRAQLIPEEIRFMKAAVRECEKLFEFAEQDCIRVGRTDRQIHEMMKGETKRRGLELSWSEGSCPVVAIGSSPAGHLGYSGATLKKGQLLRLDFGVR